MNDADTKKFSVFRSSPDRHQFSALKRGRMVIVCIGVAIGLLVGCSQSGAGFKRYSAKVETNNAALQERTRELITGAVDALTLAPSNPPTALAKTFVRESQAIVGLPTNRFDVEAILAQDKAALRYLSNQLELVRRDLAERSRLETELQKAQASLVELGIKYEAERNKGIVKRAWHWALGIFGFGGTVALLCFFPALIPLAGRVLAWLIEEIPSLASLIGLVGRKAFDSVVVGVQWAKEELRMAGHQDKVDVISTRLGIATDGSHKKLITARKEALQDVIEDAPIIDEARRGKMLFKSRDSKDSKDENNKEKGESIAPGTRIEPISPWPAAPPHPSTRTNSTDSTDPQTPQGEKS